MIKKSKSKYTKELADKICELAILGNSMNKIIKILNDSGIKLSLSAVVRWLNINDELTFKPYFYEKYQVAQKIGLQQYFENLIDYAQQKPIFAPDGKVDSGWVKHQDLYYRTGLMRLALLDRKNYGSQQTIEHTGSIDSNIAIYQLNLPDNEREKT